MKYHMMTLFLILSCSFLASSVHGAGAVKDINGKEIVLDNETTLHYGNRTVSELVTTFHNDHKQKEQHAMKFAYPNGGVINCTGPNNVIFPCVGEGSGYFINTRLVTPANLWAFATYPCGKSVCIGTDWKTAYRDEINPLGTNTVYNFVYGNVTACMADGSECATPFPSWATKSTSPGIAIRNATMYWPIVIHAQYHYESNDGKWDIISVDQYLVKGYGW